MSPKSKTVSPIVTLWLIAYNIISAIGWGAVLYKLVTHLITTNGNYQTVYPVIEELVNIVQTAA
jgi:hypothetical protein